MAQLQSRAIPGANRPGSKSNLQEDFMKFHTVTLLSVVTLFAVLVIPSRVNAQAFQLTSSTFENNAQLPLSMVFSQCTPAGGNQSPALSWTPGRSGTRSYAVVVFDVTAGFTHWGMYNISAQTTALPANAGVAGSPLGKQVYNDFGLGEQYDGPCPPANVYPAVHRYVFTVYALDNILYVHSSKNFVPFSETLFRAMIGHVLEQASIQGFYSTATP
jgi:Raf kinase inhibitor-like YbhB/YbcL family protein